MLEPAPLAQQAWIERVRGRRAPAAQDAGQHEVDRERCGEEGRPAADEQRGLLAQAPHETRHRDEDAERDDEACPRQPELQRGVVERAVQAGHRLGGIEGSGPGERQSQSGEQHADVQPRVRTRHRTPAAKVQRADAQVEQRHHHGGRARREERVRLGGQGPRELGDVVTEVAVQHGIRDPEARWPRGERGLEPPVARAEREYQAERRAREQRAAEQHPLRHRLHDLEVAESPG